LLKNFDVLIVRCGVAIARTLLVYSRKLLLHCRMERIHRNHARIQCNFSQSHSSPSRGYSDFSSAQPALTFVQLPLCPRKPPADRLPAISWRFQAQVDPAACTVGNVLSLMANANLPFLGFRYHPELVLDHVYSRPFPSAGPASFSRQSKSPRSTNYSSLWQNSWWRKVHRRLSRRLNWLAPRAKLRMLNIFHDISTNWSLVKAFLILVPCLDGFDSC